jgi:hypothetical protein
MYDSIFPELNFDLYLKSRYNGLSGDLFDSVDVYESVNPFIALFSDFTHTDYDMVMKANIFKTKNFYLRSSLLSKMFLKGLNVDTKLLLNKFQYSHLSNVFGLPIYFEPF